MPSDQSDVEPRENNGSTNPLPQELRSKHSTRRRFLKLSSAVGVAGIAGCSASDEEATATLGTTETIGVDGEDTATDKPSSAIADKAFVTSAGFSTKNAQYNPYGTNSGGSVGKYLFSYRAGWNYRDGEYVPALIKEWDYLEDAVELTVDERYTWHTGEDVTAEDLLVDFKLSRHMGPGQWPWSNLSSVEQLDKYSIRFGFGGKTRKDTALLTTLGSNQPQVINRMQYKPFLDRFEEIQGDMTVAKAYKTDAHGEVRKELGEFTPRGEDVIGNGPFVLKEQGLQQMRAELFEDHPMTVKNDGRINNSTFIAKKINRAVSIAFLEDQLDGRALVDMTESQVRQAPEKLKIQYAPGHRGLGLIFNHRNEPYGNRNVRAALAYVTNRKQVAANTSGNSPAKTQLYPKKITNLVGYAEDSPDPNEKWLGDAASKYSSYKGTEMATEEATELLQEEGFSKKNGAWHLPNGERWELIIHARARDRWINQARTFADHFSQFGIKSGVQVATEGAWWSQIIGKANFDAAVNFWGSLNRDTPYLNFSYAMHPFYLGVYYEDGGEHENRVPKEIGDFDGTSGMKSVHVPSVQQELANTLDEDRQMELRRELAWVANYDLFNIHGSEEYITSVVMGEPEWKLPPRDSKHWYTEWPAQWLFQAGEISYMGG